MKNLISVIILVFTFAITANGQQLSIGSDLVQFGVAQTSDSQSAFAEIGYTHNLASVFNIRLAGGASVIESTYQTTIPNSNTDSFRQGTDETSLIVAFRPSVMVGIDLPIDRFKIGLYSGYQSVIHESVSHNFVPLSVLLSF